MRCPSRYLNIVRSVVIPDSTYYTFSVTEKEKHKTLSVWNYIAVKRAAILTQVLFKYINIYINKGKEIQPTVGSQEKKIK